MKVRVSRVHFPVTVLGPGRRLGIWLQGCPNRCPGCISRDTWSSEHGQLVEVEQLVATCREEFGSAIEGVTITGGEPFAQAEGLAALLDTLSQWRSDRPIDILCYSGLPYAQLQESYPALLARLDALIPEPYLEDQPTTAAWRGSANQPLILLSPLGQERFRTLPSTAPGIQVAVTAGTVWFIGIPRRGDMARIQYATQERGLIMEGLSWQK